MLKKNKVINFMEELLKNPYQYNIYNPCYHIHSKNN